MNVIRPMDNSAPPRSPGGERDQAEDAPAKAALPPAEAAPRTGAAPAAAPPLAVADMHEVARRLEIFLRSVERALEFRVDAVSGRTVISVLDAGTGELIRQIPSEEALRFAQMVDDETVVLADVKA